MVNLKSGVKKRVLFDKNGVPQLSLFDVKLENGGENGGQRRSWKERSNQSLTKDHKRGETQDVRVDPEQGASNTGHAPEVDDEDPKQVEDHGGQGLRRLTQGEWSQVSKWKVRHVHFNLLQFEESCQDSWSPENLSLFSNFLKRIATS